MVVELKKESFYTEPPFNYRPSLAEYLATMKVSTNGLIADIMHLDKKGNLNIENYQEDGLIVKLKKSEDLNDNELFLWNFLESQTTKNKGLVKFSELKTIEKEYEKQVIGKAAGKFGSLFPFNPAGIPFGFVLFGLMANFLISSVGSILSLPFAGLLTLFVMGSGWYGQLITIILYIIFVIAIPLLVLFFISWNKVANSAIERKFLFKQIFLQFLKILGLMYGMLLLFVFIAIVVLASQSYWLSFTVGVIAYIIIMGFYFSNFGRLAFKYVYWLFETKETAENRKKWLAFKDFIVDNSQIKSKPLKHYELWGEFYYYALAVGVVKKPF